MPRTSCNTRKNNKINVRVMFSAGQNQSTEKCCCEQIFAKYLKILILKFRFGKQHFLIFYPF